MLVKTHIHSAPYSYHPHPRRNMITKNQYKYRVDPERTGRYTTSLRYSDGTGPARFYGTSLWMCGGGEMRHPWLVLAVILLLVGVLVLLANASASATIIRVKWDSPANGPGTTWDNAWRTVTAGINAASGGDQVWVARGTYHERLVLKNSVALYGGFRGVETSLTQRGAPRPVPNTSLQETVLDAQLGGTAVTGSGLGTSTILSGFTITNGSAANGGGISLVNSSALVLDCFIYNNQAHLGAGIYLKGGASTVANCCVVGNSPSGTVNQAGGIYNENSFGSIVNSVMAYNGGQGLDIGDGYAGTLTVANNIVYENDFGIRFRKPSFATPLLRNNNVVGYRPYEGIGAGTGDISLDPLFVNHQEFQGDYHLPPDSPCVDAGWSGLVGPSANDFDGQSRTTGAAIDIGPDELHAAPGVIYVSHYTGNDLNSGLSWNAPLGTIGAGINKAGWDTQVWVAYGSYQERIRLKSGASIYGGFEIGEAALAHRHPFPRPDQDLNRTTIDGLSGGSVVSGDYVDSFRFDGFTVTGSAGGLDRAGVSLGYADGIIENCIIENNLGSGVDMGWNNANCVIQRNIIRWNQQSGIITYGGSIRENFIVNNTPGIPTGNNGGGIWSRWGNPRIIGNTIVGNHADPYGGTGGIYVWGFDTATIYNNIIAHNDGYQLSAPYATVVSNCAFPSGISGGGNIMVDPKLGDWQNGDFHLTASSPCINAGDPGAPGLSIMDLDGDPRTLGSAPDMGADEYHAPRIIHVKKDTGSDTNSGDTWALAKKTVTAALADALSGDSIWVARGTYYERLSVPCGVRLFGGFQGTETNLRARPAFPRPQPDPNETILELTRFGSVVTFRSGATPLSTCINGFTITGGDADLGGGICCISSSPTVALNTIHGNKAEKGAGIHLERSSAEIRENIIRSNTAYARGGGIHCLGRSGMKIAKNTIQDNIATGVAGGGISSDEAVPWIEDNHIVNNRSPRGGGIDIWAGGGLISRNNIEDNEATGDDGGGVHVHEAMVEIAHNTIHRNTAAQAGGAVRCWNAPSPIVNNIIAANVAAFGGGLHLQGFSGPITNNSIVANSGTTFGGGIDCSDASPMISNNIVAFNLAGIGRFGTAAPSLHNNNVFGNVVYQYWDIAPGPEDIALDPLLVDWVHGNYRLLPNSPCIDTGWNAAPWLQALDMDAQPRVQGGTVDIGAYESLGAVLLPVEVPEAKALADHEEASVHGIVSAVFPGYFYIQPFERSSGLRISSAASVMPGDAVVADGIMKTDAATGERYLHASVVGLQLHLDPPVPMFMSNKTLGGANWQYNSATGAGQLGVKDGIGLNNIGLFVSTSGKVVQRDTASPPLWLRVDDGSGVNLMIVVPAGTTVPQVGAQVHITGVSSIWKDAAQYRPRILVPVPEGLSQMN